MESRSNESKRTHVDKRLEMVSECNNKEVVHDRRYDITMEYNSTEQHHVSRRERKRKSGQHPMRMRKG